MPLAPASPARLRKFSNEKKEEAMNEIQLEVPKEAYIQEKLPKEDFTYSTPRVNEDLVATLPPLELSTAPRRQSHNEVWTRTELDTNTHRMVAVHALQKLQALMVSYVHEFYNVRDNIERIFHELLHINHRHFRDMQSSREWFHRYCDLANDIVDWADSFTLSTRFARGTRSRSWFGRATDWFMTLHTRSAISHEIRVRVREFQVRARELQRLVSEDINVGPRPLPFQPQDILVHKHHSGLVGHNRLMEEMIEMVMNSRPMAKFMIISIVGMVGSGKTTLASAVYQQVKQQFEFCAFVYMGQQYDIVETLGGIIPLPERRDQKSSWDVEQLKWRLRTFLMNKRYLIMIDDLWSREQWEIIRYCFPENEHSRLIITTTNDALALHCSVRYNKDCIYKVGLLNDADSEQLFLNEVFVKGQGLHPHFKNNCAEIIKKCGGLPLAIVRAAMLAQRQSVHDWKRIELKSLVSSSDENYMWQRLNLSYNDLPNILKTCMLYLSIFPEYNEVDVERLMRLWIAEGFIIQGFDRDMEETARSYLDGLISRNMVLPLHVNHHGIPRCCMVHPVIHDFIVYKSREEKFIAIVNDQHRDIGNNHGTIRRLSVQSNSRQELKLAPNSSADISQLRSIIVIGQASTAPQLTDPRVLCVLDLEGCEGTAVFLDDLHKLQLLKYLNLRGTNISELPDTIWQLTFLQTLDVRSTNIKQLPPSIVMLKKLMHLLCGSAKLPPGISEMKELQTLSCAITTGSSTTIRDLSKLVDLRELELFCDFAQKPRDGQKQATFSHGGFGRLQKLCVRCNSALVAFEPNALPMVEVLELSFEGLLVSESSAVFGIEHLRSLNHVLLEFFQVDAGSMATVDIVKNSAATLHHNNPEVTVNVDERADRNVSKASL